MSSASFGENRNEGTMGYSERTKQRLKQKYGTWAVVTGASSGIGRELALRLAEAGFHLVLAARRRHLLEALAEEAHQAHRVETRIVEADLATDEGIEDVIYASQGLEVGMYVAAAGFGTSGEFLVNSLPAELAMVKVNCSALMALSHHFGQRFADQGRGGIILLSSMVAFQGVPFAANYAATKAYVQTFAEGLRAELKPLGVDVLAAAPGPVNSGFADVADMQMGKALTPEQVSVPILKALGRRTTVLPGFMTKFLVFSLRTLPRWGKIKVMSLVMGGFTKHQREGNVSEERPTAPA